VKIAFISGLYPPAVAGGAEIVLQALVEGLRDAGHEVLVLTTKEGGDIVRELVNGIPVFRVPIQNVYWHGWRDRPRTAKRAIWHALDSMNIRMLSIAKKILQEERPDTLNVHASEGWSAAVLAIGKSLGIPTVQVLHSLNVLCPNSNMFRNGRACGTRCLSCKALRVRHKAFSEDADAVVGVSQYILDRHLSAGYFSTAKHRIAIHNARDLPAAVVESPRNEATDQGKKFIFGFIGTINPAKGVELLIKEFYSVGNLEAELWIAGKGQTYFESSIRSRYASQQVKFLGYLKPAEFFPSIDVLVVPSLCQEALPTVVPEAFAFGVPVIASRRGGIPEMVRDGVNGRLYEPDNGGELANIMTAILRGEENLVSMSREAKRTAVGYLDMRGWVNKYVQVNRDVAATGKS
jgi:glycosyltransferase involved in cell wall biosynthesis